MQKNTKGFIACLIIFAYFIMFLGSAGPKKITYKPGWYGVERGWNNWNTNVDGQVGYELYVDPPRGRCEPYKNWTGSSSVVSGTLPPGLTITSNSTITGIPRERGHWLVKLRMSNIQCGGVYYKDFEQELNFHITGTMKVYN